jgi:uncharacterized protein (DUF1800 family)
MDGSPVLDEHGAPLPAYTEADVKAVARAVTGWIPHYPEMTDPENPIEVVAPAEFNEYLHDPGEKVVLGETVPADDTAGGAFDIERVVEILMHQPTMAPFISRILIQQLATETPSPGYVERVATVFADSDGDLRRSYARSSPIRSSPARR